MKAILKWWPRFNMENITYFVDRTSNFFLFALAMMAGISFLACLGASYVLVVIFLLLVAATIIRLKREERRNSKKLPNQLN